MAKILVTGATGFVGKALIPALIASGHEVRCAVSQHVAWLNVEQILVKKLELDPDWSVALSGMDVVIHLAARVHVMKEKDEHAALNDYCSVNSIATKKLAEQAAVHQIKRFIFLSSIKVNGESTCKEIPFTEESKAQPQDPYAQSKLYAEQYLRKISQNTAMEVVIIRPPLIYGPEVKANFLKILQLVKKRVPLPFRSINNQRHLVYIENLVSALCMVIEHPLAANQTYLVADDQSLSLPQLVRFIGKEMNVPVRLIPFPTGLMRGVFQLFGLKKLNTRLLGSLEVSNSKIKSHLGWKPPVTFADGLKKTVTWYQGNFNVGEK